MLIVLHVAACAMAAMLGASFSSIDNRTTMGQAAWHVMLAGVLGALSYPTLQAWWPSMSWLALLLPDFLAGFGIYSIAVNLKKTSKRLEEVQVEDMLRRKLGGDDKPGAAS